MAENYVDYGLVKKPHNDRPLTEEESEEWVKCASEFWYFATNYAKVLGPKGMTLFEPRKYQIEMIDVILGTRHSLFNSPRQSGKTILMAVYVMWISIFHPDSTSGFTSFKGSNVKDFIKRCQTVYEYLPDFLKPPVTRYNTTEIAFTNNSMVYAEVSSETALRGRTITGNGVAILDELAFVSMADEMLTSLLPALEAAGEEATTKVIIISTPNSSTGKYAELVNGAIEGTNEWTYYKVDPSLIPGRTEEWKAKQIRNMGINKFRQEFEGYFLSDNSSLINSAIIESIEAVEPVRQVGDLKLWINSFNGRKVAISVDVAEGVGKDNSSFQIFDLDSLEQVGEYAYNMVNQNQYFRIILKTVHMMYEEGVSEVYMGIERNGLGNGILRLIENSMDEKLSNVTQINEVDSKGVASGRSGLVTTAKTKLEGCALLKELVEEGKLTLRSKALLNELRMFTKQGATFKAERGAKDDRVMATVVLMNMFKQISNYEEGLYDVINEVSLDAQDEDWSTILF